MRDERRSRVRRTCADSASARANAKARVRLRMGRIKSPDDRATDVGHSMCR